MIVRHLESIDRCQFVVCIKWRGVATGTAFVLKNFLPLLSPAIQLIGILRWRQRVNIERQSVELLITVAPLCVRRGLSVKVPCRRNKAVVACQVVRTLIKGGVTHQVHYRALELETSVVEILSFSEADQIGDLCRIKRRGTVSRENARRNGVVPTNNLIERPGLHPCQRIFG